MRIAALVFLLLLPTALFAKNAGPDNEFAELKFELRTVRIALQSEDFYEANSTLDTICYRLMLFEMKFGVKAHQHSLYPELSKQAKFVLNRYKKYIIPDHAFSPSPDDSSFLFLYELANSKSRIDTNRIPSFIELRGWDRLRYLSSYHLRRGNFKKSLQIYSIAENSEQGNFYRKERYWPLKGFLLYKTGDRSKGIELLERTHLFPESIGNKASISFLKSHGKYRPLTSRFFLPYLSSKYWHQTVVALCQNSFNDSFDIITSCKQMKSLNAKLKIISALGTLKDRRVVKHLESYLVDSPFIYKKTALISLLKLRQHQYLPHFLSLWKSHYGECFSTKLHQTLVDLFPEGPKLPDALTVSFKTVSRCWTRWNKNKVSDGLVRQNSWLFGKIREPLPDANVRPKGVMQSPNIIDFSESDAVFGVEISDKPMDARKIMKRR